MGVKAQYAASGLMAPNWLTKLGSTSFTYNTTGLHTLIPAPPVGKIRAVNASSSSYGPVLTAALTVPSNGTVIAGDFDFTPQIGSAIIGAPVLASSGLYLPDVTNPLILLPGEDFSINIAAFNSGSNRVVGIASWFDLDQGPNIHVVRTTTPDMTLVVLIPTVAANKTAATLSPPSLLTFASAFGFVYNGDDITHNFFVDTVVGGIAVASAPVTVNSLTAGKITPPGTIPAGGFFRITMGETVSTVIPNVYGAYTILDVA